MAKRVLITDIKIGSIFYLTGIDNFSNQFVIRKCRLMDVRDRDTFTIKYLNGNKYIHSVDIMAFSRPNILGIFKRLPKLMKVLYGY